MNCKYLHEKMHQMGFILASCYVRCGLWNGTITGEKWKPQGLPSHLLDQNLCFNKVHRWLSAHQEWRAQLQTTSPGCGLHVHFWFVYILHHSYGRMCSFLRYPTMINCGSCSLVILMFSAMHIVKVSFLPPCLYEIKAIPWSWISTVLLHIQGISEAPWS